MTQAQTLKRRLGLSAVSVLFVLLGCGKDNGIGTGNGNETQGGNNTISELTVISSTADKRSLVGRKVSIADAPVDEVVGNYVFWAGDTHSGVPIVREDKMRTPVVEHVRRGDRVRVLGTVRLLESVPVSDLMWDKVNENERRDILAAQVYIAAESVAIRK